MISNASRTRGLHACGTPRVNLKGVRDLVNRVSKLAGFEGLVEPANVPVDGVLPVGPDSFLESSTVMLHSGCVLPFGG
jgi:hypothetical protein